MSATLAGGARHLALVFRVVTLRIGRISDVVLDLTPSPACFFGLGSCKSVLPASHMASLVFGYVPLHFQVPSRGPRASPAQKGCLEH